MTSIRATILAGKETLGSNMTIPLLRSARSNKAYDLVYSLQQLFKGRHTFDAIILENQWRDHRYPNARPDTQRYRVTDKSGGVNFFSEEDVKKYNREFQDPEYTLRVIITLLTSKGGVSAAIFDFHRCWQCDARADLVDRARMESFCSAECHSLRLAALPCEPPRDDDGFWRGPYDVLVPKTINQVPARDGFNRHSKDGSVTEMGVPTPLSEAEWKAKYAYKKDGKWYYRV